MAHSEFVDIGIDGLKKMLGSDDISKKVIIDVKGLYDIESLKKSEFSWWRL